MVYSDSSFSFFASFETLQSFDLCSFHSHPRVLVTKARAYQSNCINSFLYYLGPYTTLYKALLLVGLVDQVYKKKLTGICNKMSCAYQLPKAMRPFFTVSVSSYQHDYESCSFLPTRLCNGVTRLSEIAAVRFGHLLRNFSTQNLLANERLPGGLLQITVEKVLYGQRFPMPHQHCMGRWDDDCHKTAQGLNDLRGS